MTARAMFVLQLCVFNAALVGLALAVGWYSDRIYKEKAAELRAQDCVATERSK